ncbi:hypothetical protein FGO68_gene13403 [Halteria grandinella]|uniref:Uncharacterized protein n=1 Tax=Halteria grandinella TaxID=5974 RepID=A0A8J8TAC7_HALGN|nr:hypothetical protein FGO68_gene13403 [Halteria grandinella]
MSPLIVLILSVFLTAAAVQEMTDFPTVLGGWNGDTVFQRIAVNQDSYLVAVGGYTNDLALRGNDGLDGANIPIVAMYGTSGAYSWGKALSAMVNRDIVELKFNAESTKIVVVTYFNDSDNPGLHNILVFDIYEGELILQAKFNYFDGTTSKNVWLSILNDNECYLGWDNQAMLLNINDFESSPQTLLKYYHYRVKSLLAEIFPQSTSTLLLTLLKYQSEGVILMYINNELLCQFTFNLNYDINDAKMARSFSMLGSTIIFIALQLQAGQINFFMLEVSMEIEASNFIGYQIISSDYVVQDMKADTYNEVKINCLIFNKIENVIYVARFDFSTGSITYIHQTSKISISQGVLLKDSNYFAITNGDNLINKSLCPIRFCPEDENYYTHGVLFSSNASTSCLDVNEGYTNSDQTQSLVEGILLALEIAQKISSLLLKSRASSWMKMPKYNSSALLGQSM